MILFAAQFTLTNIIFSVIIYSVLARLNKKHNHSNLELFLYSLGLGPAFTSILLFYLFLFLPHQISLFYFLGVLISYLILLWIGRKYLAISWSNAWKRYEKTRIAFSNSKTLKRIEIILFSSFIIFLLAFFLLLYLSNTLHTPLDGTDALKYGTLGKIIFKEKSLESRWIRPYPETGFSVSINHAPSFSLLLTWEKILDSFFNADKDLYFKSTSTYYGLLILILMFFWLSKKNKYLALLGIIALLSGFSFFQTLITQHLDSYRIFFLAISWIFLAYFIEKKDALSFWLFGIFSGFAAFAHTIGAVIVVFNCLALFIFMNGKLKYRLKQLSAVTILIIAFGWLHYILDIFWGFGWIIFRRDITFWG